MYKVNLQVRSDILGEILGNVTVLVDEPTKEKAEITGKMQAHEKYCHSYKVPVHFLVKKVKFVY
jgi:hypothetical protein